MVGHIYTAKERAADIAFAVAAERERCAKICQDQRGSKKNIVAPLTNAAYDEACRDCEAAILQQ